MDVKVLLVDDTMDPPARPSRALGADFRRYIARGVEVRRAPERDLPSDPTHYSHIILSGSKTSILEDAAWISDLLNFVQRAYDAKIPLLGICYGHQIIARLIGGKTAVGRSPTPEVGWHEIEITQSLPIFEGLPNRVPVFQSHFDEVRAVPPGAVIAAKSERCSIQAYGIVERSLYGVQFHPERNIAEGDENIALHKRRRTPPDILRSKIKGDRVRFAQTLDQLATTIFGNFLKTEQLR